jgi:hypothetical protein
MSGPALLDLQTPRVFLPLLGAHRYKGAHGGRGSGKSHFFAESAVELCLMQPGTRIVCAREIQKSLRQSVHQLLADKIIKMGVEDRFGIRNDHIKTPGDGIVLFQGMQDHTAESVKSLEGFNVGYFEEAQTMTQRSLEMLRPTIRAPGSELWFSWNPRNASDPVDMLLRAETLPPRAAVVEANWRDNPFFPLELEEERQFDEENNPTRYGHIWEGEYEPAVIGAIWTREIIHRNRVEEAPPLERIIVGVDPAASSEAGSDYTGIVAVGLGKDGHAYVLEDSSLHGTPGEWAEQVVATFDLQEADMVVAEINNGGEMVKHTLHTERRTLPVDVVHATRGKHIRAEPISALYKRNMVHHVGAYPELEGQLCQFTAAGYEGAGSPDRADAMIWACTKLFGRLTKKPPNAKTRPASQNNRYNPHRRHERKSR